MQLECVWGVPVSHTPKHRGAILLSPSLPLSPPIFFSPWLFYHLFRMKQVPEWSQMKPRELISKTHCRSVCWLPHPCNPTPTIPRKVGNADRIHKRHRSTDHDNKFIHLGERQHWGSCCTMSSFPHTSALIYFLVEDLELGPWLFTPGI